MQIVLFGAGYVASHLISHLPNQRICAITYTSTNFHNLTTYPILSTPASVITKHLVDAEVIIIGVSPRDDLDYYTTYVGSVERVISSNTTAHIIFISSTAVYGDCEGILIDEQYPCNPTTESGIAIFEAEQRLQSYTKKLTIFRLGGIYGPGRDFTNGLRSFLPGTGNEYLNLSPISLITRSISAAITHQLYGIFNVTDNAPIERKQFYEKIAKKHHLPAPTFDPLQKLKHGGNRRINSERIQTILTSLGM